MKYSVIIPAYKCESTLEKTVNSIQNCGLTDFEIILVNDGSPDGTPALCDRLAAEQENVRRFHQPNGGVSSARNHGLSEAKGDYVWFFDSDDLVDPGSMERAAQIIEAHAPDMLIFGMSFDYYHKNRMYQRLELYYDEEREMTPAEVDVVFDELYRNNSLTSSCNKLFRRTVLVKNGLHYDTAMFSMEDFYFVLTVLQYCETIYLLPKVIYRYIQPLEQTKRKHGRNHDRMARIPNTAEYLEVFRPLLDKQPKVLIDLYYMMIEEKLRKQKPVEIAKTAKEVLSSPYASGEYYELCGQGQKNLVKRLREQRYNEVFAQNLKRRIRAIMVRYIKRTWTYQQLRGSKNQRS